MNLGSAVHFSYDAHGRVSFIVNEIYIFGNSARHKTVDYIYGPLTGRIEQVIYQKGNQNEEFRHRYSYDADGRLVKAEVSLNGTSWSPAAEYAYYLHGPLKRARLGDNVQDVDYAYNINGWLKAINNVLPLPGEGQVTIGSPGRDVFSEVLHYYSGDYQRLGTGLEATALVNPSASTGLRTSGPDLFNGNIAIAVSYTGFDQVTGNTTLPVMGQSYRYDYLNRLSRVFTETYSAAAFPGYADVQDIVLGISDPYSMRMTYDANGNILSLKRNAALRTFVPQAGSSMGGGTTPQTSTELDKLAYKYTATVTDHYGVVRKTNNRLSQVVDTAHSEGLGDIFTQASGNYEYDEKGRLTRDLKNDIEKIEWTAYDKVKKITRTSGSTLPGIEYTYDSRQQRLTKKLVYATAALNETTIYVYDAAGVLMAAYTQYFDAATNTLKVRLDEEYMYGLSRVGVYKPATVRGPLTLSQLRFELTDHLGNVRAVVSGQKKVNNDANILSLTDYYAFGQTMPGRSFVSEEYRYGYQGSEREAESWGGQGITTDFRMLDTRLGRWFSVDKMRQAWQSPFTSMDNDPISLTDILGLQAGGGNKGGGSDDFVLAPKSNNDNEGRYNFNPSTTGKSNMFSPMNISSFAIQNDATKVNKTFVDYNIPISNAATISEAFSAKVTLGFQAGIEGNLGKNKIGAEINMGSIDVVGVKDNKVYSPFSKDNTVTVSQGVGITFGKYGFEYQRQVTKTETSPKEYLNGFSPYQKISTVEAIESANINILVIQGQVSSIQKQRIYDGMPYKSQPTKSTTGTVNAKANLNTLGIKASVIVGVEMNVDLKTLRKAILR